MADNEVDPRDESLWPEPTMPEPSEDELFKMGMDSMGTATDGCTVENDSVCEHGHPAWMLKLGYI